MVNTPSAGPQTTSNGRQSSARTKRWDTKGLSPKHTAHLRALIQQWLSQQTTQHAGVPGITSRSRLWDDDRVKHMENVMYKALLVAQRDAGRNGLLEIDWADWAARTWRRRDIWKQEQADQVKRKHKETTDRSTLRFLKRASRSEVDMPKRGRQLSVGTPTAIPSMLPSIVSTPTRPPTRPVSIASSIKSRSSVKPDEFSDQLAAGLAKTLTAESSGSSESDEALQKWCDSMRALKGYEPLLTGSRDGWEVVDEDQPRSTFRMFPGAFPQGEQYIAPDQTPTTPHPGPPVEATKDCPMLKAIFCLHFVPAPPPSATASNASTVRFRDRSSGSIGSNAAWWAPNKRPSELTIKAADTREFDIHFVQGKFALPLGQRRVDDGRPSSIISPAAASLQRTFSNEFSDWSGSGRSSTGSKQNNNIIIGGDDDDLPSEVTEGAIGLVGGTFVVQGVSDPTERDYIAKTLQHLLFAIQSMKLELEVVDAFRVPRETESPFGTTMNIGPMKQNIVRRSSVKEPRDKRSFFGRFVGRDPREVLDNIFRPHRSRLGQEDPSDDPLYGTRQRSPSFDSLGLDSPDLGLVADRNPPLGSVVTAKERRIFPVDPETDYDMLANMKRLKLSTTPGLVVPPPTLLQRAEDEARKRRPDHAEGLGLIFGQDVPIAHLPERPSGNRSGGDVRVGLKAFRTDIDTFEGWAKYQRLETLRCVGTGSHAPGHENLPDICQKPEPETFIFFDHERDTSLLDVLRGLQVEMDDMVACTKSGCVATAQDHLKTWYHGSKKVTLRAQRVKAEAEQDSEVQEHDADMAMEAWMSCPTCSASSEAREMTEGATCFSWGKLMELLIYSNVLRPPAICPHPHPEHVFKGAGVIASVSVESFNVLDMRLPQLQVGPNVTKRKPGKDAAEDALESLANDEERNSAQDQFARERKTYCHSVGRAVIHLQDLAMAADDVMLHPDNNEKPGFRPDDRTDMLRLTGSEIERLWAEFDEVVSHIPPSQINDARALLALQHDLFVELLTAFLKDNDVPGSLSDAPFDMPEYLQGHLHALPGGSLLVREDDPSSIIAHTLSSLAYYTELGGSKKATDDPPNLPSITMPERPGDQWKVEVRRRDNVQDLFTLRNITKKQSDVSATPSKPSAMAVTQPLPSLELSLEQVQGESESHDHLGDLVKSIHKAACQDPVLAARTDSPRLQSRHASPSLASLHEHAADDGWGSPKRNPKRLNGLDHRLPEAIHPISRTVSTDGSSVPITPNSSAGSGKEEGWGSVTSNFTSALLKMGSGVGETLGSFRMRGGERSLSSMLGPLSSMSQSDNALATAHNRLPHIVFTYTLGERLKISCTIYFAEAFDSLRRRCAIEKAMIDSLSQVENWDASGGKSKAAFFMTKDKRFIVKELVAGWIGSDTNAMLELAPEYFKFTQSTYNKATSLVKIVGFFSVMTHDRKSGSKKNMDLLVMENLFHDHEIVKTYDLKGIEGRKVAKPAAPPAGTAEAKAAGSATLWDGDWLESISRRPVLLYPHAKRILTEAIATDTRFLAAQSVMDYSLLLGLDKDQKELVVGIVDSIGSYDLWKTIESKGKMLTRGGEVTVIPPDQYKDRFENALNKYFLACPDKWSKPAPGDTPTRPLSSFL